MEYSLGKKIKELRVKCGLSQEELAEKMNEKFNSTINKGMISKWENNLGEPRLEAARQLSTFFEISLDSLLGLENNTTTPDDIEILTLAAHQVGHKGALSEKEMEQIKLALRIALSKNDN